MCAVVRQTHWYANYQAWSQDATSAIAAAQPCGADVRRDECAVKVVPLVEDTRTRTAAQVPREALAFKRLIPRLADLLLRALRIDVVTGFTHEDIGGA